VGPLEGGLTACVVGGVKGVPPVLIFPICAEYLSFEFL
jgi:hypothetical protein